MKKTQPIDWDKVIFEELSECIFVYFNDGNKYAVIDSDFIAAFDEMLENEIENRIGRIPTYWDDVDGWKPLWIETGSYYYLNNA